MSLVNRFLGPPPPQPPRRQPPVTHNLNEQGQVTIDVNGAGTVSIGPNNPLVRWHITTAAVSVNSDNQIPTCYLYRGTPSPGNFISGTVSGSNDTADINQTLFPGEKLTAVWGGADVGSQASLSLFGSIEIYARGQ